MKAPIQEERFLPQIIAILIASISTITYGILFAWTSPFIVMILEDKKNYSITEDEASFFTVIPPISMILLVPAFGKLSDAIGRKKVLLILTVPHMLSFLFTVISNNVWVLYLSRFCVGIGDACVHASLPIYIGEISVPKIRGSCGNLFSTFTLVGVFMINVIGSYFDVRQSGLICMVLPITYCILMLFMPESPYYYMSKGNEESAKKSLRWLRGIEDVDEICNKLKIDMKRQLSERGTWKDLFLVRANRRALAAGVFLRVSQQLIGTGTITMYTKFIFEQSEAGLSSETTSMVASGLGLICVFISGFLLEILGRKKLFIWSLGVCSITLIIMGIYFCIEQYAIDINLEAVKWTPMVCTILYTIGIDSGCFSIPTLMAGELFSASIKAKAVSVLIWTYGIMLFVSNNIFHFLNVSVGLYAPFLLFGIISIFSVFITTHLVPETKGKTLEEIQQELCGNNVKTTINRGEDGVQNS